MCADRQNSGDGGRFFHERREAGDGKPVDRGDEVLISGIRPVTIQRDLLSALSQYQPFDIDRCAALRDHCILLESP